MMPELFPCADYSDAGAVPEHRPCQALTTPAPLLNHTYACALPSRGACCDCGVHPADHLR